MQAVNPGEPFNVETLCVAEFMGYYRQVKRSLEPMIDMGPHNDTHPNPVLHCDICTWWSVCHARCQADDHLCFVPGIQKSQIGELARQGIDTLTAFAEHMTPLPAPPLRSSTEAFAKTPRQTQIQFRGRQLQQPVYELPDVDKAEVFCGCLNPMKVTSFLTSKVILTHRAAVSNTCTGTCAVKTTASTRTTSCGLMTVVQENNRSSGSSARSAVAGVAIRACTFTTMPPMSQRR